MVKKQKHLSLNACCMCMTEEGVWFVQGMCPILYYYNFGAERITIAEPLNIGETYGTAYFREIYRKKDELYLVPNNSKKIAIYNITNKILEYVSVKDAIANEYQNCYEYNDILYFIPYKARQVIKLELDNHKIIKYIDIYEDKENVCINSTCRMGNTIYCVLWNSSQILMIDLESETASQLQTSGGHRFSQISTYGKNFLLYDMQEKALLIYEPNFEKILRTIKVDYEDAMLIVGKEGECVVDSAVSNEILIMNDEFKREKRIEFYVCNQLMDTQPWTINAWSLDKDRFIWGISTNGYLFKVIAESQKLEKKELVISEKLYSELNKKLIQIDGNNIVMERTGFALENFLNSLNY